MKLPALLTRVLPTLNRAQECPACGQPFACEINLQGCWCTEVKLSAETLQRLRSKYKGCLCRSCLESAQAVSERANGVEYPERANGAEYPERANGVEYPERANGVGYPERANGAEYDSQGQARSASPLDPVPSKSVEP